MSANDVLSAAELNPAHAISVAAPAALDGRRRPGRPEQVSPHLVPLLRDPAEPELSGPLLGTAEVMSFNEDLLIARGFGVAMLLAVPAWAGIGLIIWLVLR